MSRMSPIPWAAALGRAFRLAFVLAVALPAVGRAGPVEDAEAALQRGSLGQALRTLAVHLDKNPDDVVASELQIDILLTIGQGGEAARHWRQAIVDNPKNPDAWYLLGRSEVNPDTAMAAYQKALELKPRHARALTGLGAVQSATGKTTAAAENFQAALDVDPTLAEAWSGLIRSRAIAGDRSAAESAARRAVIAVPHSNGVWLALAALVPDDAVSVLTQAASRLPEDPQIQINLARSLFTSTKWDRAEKAYDRALSLVPDGDAQLQVERAMIAEIKARRLSLQGATTILEIRPAASQAPDVALSTLAEVVSSNPESGWARLVHGNLLSSVGRVAEAERELRSALVALPSSPEAWGAVGAFYLSQRRAAEARPLLEKATAARPTDPGLAVAAAVAAAEMGKLDQAELELRKAVTRFPHSIGPTLALARLLVNGHRGEEAFVVLTDALRRSPEVNLASALASAARELGQPGRAVELMRQLADETGDPRFSRVADGLSAETPALPTPPPAP